MSVVRYPTRKFQKMSNGVTWVRWHGFGVWSQDKQRASENHKTVVWPMRPYVRLWGSRRRRVALLLPYRD